MGLFDLLRKGKSKKTEIADTVKVAVPKPEREQKMWQCSCGRKNFNYVSTCTCGTNKREIVISAVQQFDKAYTTNNTEKNKWTSQEDDKTTIISITSKGENTIRQYMCCNLDDDQVFEGVTVAGAKITRIGMTEVHDWDDRDWYTAGFDSYEAYLQDEEHDKYICQWSADAEYSGIAITFRKPHNMVRHGLAFHYDSTDEARLAEFFEMFDKQCCKEKTVIDKKDAIQKQSNSNNTPKKEPIEKTNAPLLKKDVPQKQTPQRTRENIEQIVSTGAMDAGQMEEDTTTPNIRGYFDGILVKVLKEEYQKFGFGFEKIYRKDCILHRGIKNYYYQQIKKEVAAEANGRPVTYYSEYVYTIKSTNIDDISMDNIGEFVDHEPIFDKVTGEYGVLF